MRDSSMIGSLSLTGNPAQGGLLEEASRARNGRYRRIESLVDRVACRRGENVLSRWLRSIITIFLSRSDPAECTSHSIEFLRPLSRRVVSNARRLSSQCSKSRNEAANIRDSPFRPRPRGVLVIFSTIAGQRVREGERDDNLRRGRSSLGFEPSQTPCHSLPY